MQFGAEQDALRAVVDRIMQSAARTLSAPIPDEDVPQLLGQLNAVAMDLELWLHRWGVQ